MKVKKFFKEVFSSRKTKIAFFACLLSCLMLLSVTFAWFYNVISLPQNQITTGTISYVVKGYDAEGKFISTIIDPEDITNTTVNPNEPLFNLSGIGVNEYTTAYISIETTGSLDLEYSLNFKVNGSESDMLYIGGLWFKIEELDELDCSEVKDSRGNSKGDEEYDASLVDYTSIINPYATTSGEVIICDQKCKASNYTQCTQHNILTKNLITMNSHIERGILNKNKKATIYRIDVGMKNISLPQNYSGLNLVITGHVHGTQVGGIDDELGGSIHKVIDAHSLDLAIENALPGDTIQLANSIAYHGDVILNKAINITTYGKTLTIYGNLICDYVSNYTVKFNMAQGGNIYVYKENGAGGQLNVNTPNSSLIIAGNNQSNNLYVEGKATINVTNDKYCDGLLLTGASILSKEGNKKDILVDSNSRLTIEYGSGFDHIEALPNATNIEIINRGTIKYINLNNMMLLDTIYDVPNVYTSYPQILINNYGTIENDIQLPTWAYPYGLDPVIVNDKTYYVGNTLIYRQVGASSMSIIDRTNATYRTADIIDYNVSDVCVVQKAGNNDISCSISRICSVYYRHTRCSNLSIY